MTGERQRGHVYYRCHRVDCQTRCVREEAIADAVLETLRGMKFDQASADKLADAAQKFGEDSRDGVRALELQLAQDENRLQRLADAYIDNMVDQNTYQARRQALLTTTIRLREEIQNRRTGRNRDADPSKFFEHMKSLPDLFISANSAERREIVEITTSNREVHGKYVYLKPAEWLEDAHSAVAAYSGDPYRPTSRRHPRREQFDEFIGLAGSDKAMRLIELHSKLRQSRRRV